MSTPSNRPDDHTALPSIAEAIGDLTPATGDSSENQIEKTVQVEATSSEGFNENGIFPRPSYEPSKSLRVIGSRSPKKSWGRLTLALAFAAGLAFIIFDDPPLPWSPPGSLSSAQKSRGPANHQFAKLIVDEATPRPVDQPVPLGVSVDNASDPDFFLVISGLPKGTTLSAGRAVGDDGWSLYATEIKDAVIRPPPRFDGVMKLTATLIVGPGVYTSEGQPLRFEWVAEKAPETKLPDEAPPVAQVQNEAPPMAKVQDEAPPVAKAQDEAPPAPKAESEAPPMAKIQDEAPPLAKVQNAAPPASKAQDEAPAAAKPKTQAIRQLSPEERAALLKRGNQLVASGDLAAARLVLQRAAEAGDARAAFALAETYNPITLEKLEVHGLSPDLALARHWYERANELGSPEALQELQILTIRPN